VKTNTFASLAIVVSLALTQRANPCFAMEESQPARWNLELSLYALAAGLTGDVTVRGLNADFDANFSGLWDHLEFGAMSKLRVGYKRWAMNADLIYMALGASKGGIGADLDQWVVEPSLSYAISRRIEVLAGVRYNNINGEIRGPGVLSPPRIFFGTQDWWDPIVGANLSLPFAKRFSFNFRGDIGGFGMGSDLTWQAFPYVSWHMTEQASVQAGYRWVSTDYDTGSGAKRFRYDVLTHGAQVGFTYRF
jgi:hypothetical protein